MTKGWSEYKYQTTKNMNTTLSVNDVEDTFKVCPLENGQPNLDKAILLTLEEVNEVGRGESLVEVCVPVGNNIVERVICFTDVDRFRQFDYNFGLGFADLDC